MVASERAKYQYFGSYVGEKVENVLTYIENGVVGLL